MNCHFLITSKDIQIFKQKARKLKQEKGITHSQALDEVAQQYNLNHWHHVCESFNATEPTEIAFQSGLIIVMDAKEAGDFSDEQGIFIQDEYASWFCKEIIFRQYMDEIDDDGIPFKDKYSEEELKQDFEESYEMDYVFFRYTSKNLPETVESVNNLVDSYCFWSPVYIWLKGKFYSNYL